MKKIKVLHLSETFVTGVYTYIQSICAFTAQYPNIETTIVYSPNRIGTDKLDLENDFSKETHLVPVSMQREISLSKDYKSLKKLQKAIKSIQPDVIHLHSSKAGVLGRIAAKSYPKARVYYTPNGYSFLREDISTKKQKLYKFIEGIMPKLFGGETIACGDTEYYYAQQLGKATMVKNGIDLIPLDKIKIKTPQNLKSLVTLGRISPQKNPILFNEIALEFPNLKFIWIGDGELKHELKAPNIEVTGWLDRQHALEQLAFHDVYIQSSLWEGLPFTIIEAMALQKPILATNVIGNKDAVEHGKNGYLCNTPNDFKKAIDQLLSNPALLKKYGDKSKELSQNKFNRDLNFKALAEIYLSKK